MQEYNGNLAFFLQINGNPAQLRRSRIDDGKENLEHLQEFAKIYLANPVFCQLLKSYAK
jgi:hypothetical protein